jgi:S1-C subfamily serine protease
MKMIITMILIGAIGAHPSFAQAPPQGDLWRAFAQNIEVGSRVKVRLHDGRRVTATLIRADAGELLVQPRTRVPVPVQAIPYDEVASLERDNSRGIGAAKAVALGVATGVGAFLGTLLIMIATID